MTLSKERKPLFYSLILHLSILLILVVKPYFSSGVKPFERSIRVDIVAMPEKGQQIKSIVPTTTPTIAPTIVPTTAPTIAPKAKNKSKKKAKEEEKKEIREEKIKEETGLKKKTIPSKNVTTEVSEMEAFKKLEALKKKKKEQKKEEEEELSALREKKQVIKGNRTSKGTGLIGVEKLEYTNYKEVLHAAISADWELPKWLLESNLQAVVEIKIDHDGNLVYKNLVQSSGNKIYDEKVMEAVVNSAPFDPPSDKFKGIVLYEGVVLTFP